MSTMMNEADNNDPLLTAAAETAWLEYAKGTYSNIDKRIFVEGFRRGVNWQQRRVKTQRQGEEEHGYPNFSNSGMPLG